MKLRGHLTVFLAGVVLVTLDLVQRTVVVGLGKLFPARRVRIYARWQRFLAHAMIGVVRLAGGARIEPLPTVPGGPGVLIVMNHQSLLDIPLLVASLDGRLYPRIVTRSRYARGKPLISHMVRLYQYPVVDPRATTKHQLSEIEEAAATATVPLAIFPEGTRTRDGEIGRFKQGGLTKILETRQWEVHVLVADGFWQAAKLEDFLSSVSRVRGRVVHLGPFQSPAPGEPVEAFIEELRGRMIDTLAEMREAVPS